MSEAEVREILGARPASELFSVRGRRYKELGLDAARLSDDEMVALMAREPGLIRRPIMRADGDLVVGFDRKRLEEVLS